ncbi:hypothetical protein [Halomarina pelagica]|uniref:hypothetical protein n=1 Tax=Halomarina pelagica TaxID=2961599 RepID=UPI0020C3D022|nr:hypothetical protein [Halomarina sp. BND7]
MNHHDHQAGDHDPGAPFFAGAPFDEDQGEPIDAADTDDLLGDALAVKTEPETETE